MMIYAIDFGTSNSLLAAADKDTIYAPIALDEEATDPTILRSILYFPDPNNVFFGQRAIKEFVSHDLEGRFLRSFKKFLPMRSFIGTYVDNRPIHLEDIIAAFLRTMRERANKHFRQNVTRVLLGRPARFSESEGDDLHAQERLALAARRAGFEDVHFCAEPLAAAYEFQTTLSQPKTVFVADFGGGTSDFTVIRLYPGHGARSEVLSIGGVAVAGDALDGCLMRKRISKHFGADVKYRAPLGSNILTMPVALMEKISSPAEISVLRERDTQEFLRNVRSWSLDEQDRRKMDQLFDLIHEQLGFAVFEQIEATKRLLSNEEEADFFFSQGAISIHEKIRLHEFLSYSEITLVKILKCMDDTISRAAIAPRDIDLVYATGGTAKVRAIRDALETRFGNQKIQQHKNFHSVVSGLASAAQKIVRQT